MASNKVKIREATVHIPINKQECVSFKQSCIIAKKIIAITIQIQLFSKKIQIPIKIKIKFIKIKKHLQIQFICNYFSILIWKNDIMLHN